MASIFEITRSLAMESWGQIELAAEHAMRNTIETRRMQVVAPAAVTSRMVVALVPAGLRYQVAPGVNADIEFEGVACQDIAGGSWGLVRLVGEAEVLLEAATAVAPACDTDLYMSVGEAGRVVAGAGNGVIVGKVIDNSMFVAGTFPVVKVVLRFCCGVRGPG